MPYRLRMQVKDPVDGPLYLYEEDVIDDVVGSDDSKANASIFPFDQNANQMIFAALMALIASHDPHPRSLDPPGSTEVARSGSSQRGEGPDRIVNETFG